MSGEREARDGNEKPDNQAVQPRRGSRKNRNLTLDDPIWSLAGSGESADVTDVAKNRQEYLAEAFAPTTSPASDVMPVAQDDPIMGLVGIGRSGVGDISENKHAYLAEAYKKHRT